MSTNVLPESISYNFDNELSIFFKNLLSKCQFICDLNYKNKKVNIELIDKLFSFACNDDTNIFFYSSYFFNDKEIINDLNDFFLEV